MTLDNLRRLSKIQRDLHILQQHSIELTDEIREIKQDLELILTDIIKEERNAK
jgi:hypothetical protein